MPRDKKKKAESDRRYREANRERLIEKKREYYQANKDRISEHTKQYREANKEIISERKKKYRENNKEKVAEAKRTWVQNNKEKLAIKKSNYNRTPNGIRILRINRWKHWGVRLPDEYGDNWGIFYEEEYMKATKCEECFVELTEDKKNTSTTKCLDHCHITGEFRNILCHACNNRRK